MDSYENLAGETVTATKTLDPFQITSGSSETLENIPAGVSMTIAEETDADNNYNTRISVDGSAAIEGKISNAFTVGENPADSTNKTHTVVFRNVLKSYPVTFKLVDQDGNTTINGMFSLSSSVGSLGSGLYASATSTNPPAGVFYTSSKLWADTYKLSQTVVPSGYLGLEGEATLTVTGNGITSNNENVAVSGNATDGYVITVRNWKTVDITLKTALLDPMVSRRSFVLKGTYQIYDNNNVLTGTYDLTGNKLKEDYTQDDIEEINLTAIGTNDGSVSSDHIPRKLSIPVKARNLVVWEDVGRLCNKGKGQDGI